jgi:hypothetical protein
VAHDLVLLLNGTALTWAKGLGFLDRKYRYFPGLPLETIRNADLGLAGEVGECDDVRHLRRRSRY